MKACAVAAMSVAIIVAPLAARAQTPGANRTSAVVGSGMGASGVAGRPNQNVSGVVGSGMGASGIAGPRGAQAGVTGAGMGTSGVTGAGTPGNP
jgi:hypothetical protein